MSTRLSSFALASALVAAASPVWGASLYVNNDGLCGGHSPCYTSIQAAIAAALPGDDVIVQPGLYSITSRIDVDKSVKILGPQMGVNPLPSNGTPRIPGDTATEAIVDGGFALSTLIRITADNVEINGMEVRNGTGDLIDSQVATPTSGTIVRNNIIHGSSGDEGVQLRAVAGAVIECNHVYGTAGDGLNLCCGATNGLIRYNELHDISSLDAALYVYGATSTTIEGNLVYNTSNNEGIKLGSKNGADAGGTGGTIRNNTVHDTRQDCIAVYMSNTTVSCNRLYGSTSENGCIYLAWAIANVSVTGNDIHDNVLITTKWGDPGAIMIGTDVNAATITVSNNRLANNTPNGITNKAAALLVAENNWWGAASGPGPVGPGTGDRVSTNVDYDPWLVAAPTLDCPAVGTCGVPSLPVQAGTWGQLKSIYR